MMTMPIRSFRRILRSMEQHLADQAEQREGKAIAAHMAGVNASIGKPSKRRHSRAERMPYRYSIALAFAALAGALASLAWWYS